MATRNRNIKLRHDASKILEGLPKPEIVLDPSDLQLVVTIKLPHPRRFAIRRTVAVWLLRLGCFVMPISSEIELKSMEDK